MAKINSPESLATYIKCAAALVNSFCVQDRINREVVNVTTLPIPAELAGLLQAASGVHTQTWALTITL